MRIKNIDDIVIFASELWPKYDFNADLYLLQRKIWRDKKNINMTISREANVSFRNSSHKAKNIYARADNNNSPGVAHNRNRYWRLFTMTITE